jgi:formate-dependent nitrite reductase membrane component NrfD
VAEIATFHWQGLIVATIIHILASLLVGLLYGSMLPMLPRRPVLLGGIVAPVLWTGLLHSTMGIINPVLDAHIAWGWFVASQIFFGVVAGSVVARAERIQTVASLPLMARLGVETPGLIHSQDEEKEP